MGAIEIVLTSFKMPFEKRETFRVTGFQLLASLVIILLSIIPFVMVLSGIPLNTEFTSPEMASTVLTLTSMFLTIFFVDLILLWVINAWTSVMFVNQVNVIYSKSTIAFKELMNQSKSKIKTVIGIDIILNLIMITFTLTLGYFMLSGSLTTFTESMALSATDPTAAISTVQNFSMAINNFSNLLSILSLLIAPLFILAIPIAVIEKKGAIESIKQSFEIGKQNYVSLIAMMLVLTAFIFIALIPTVIILLIIAGITGLIFGLTGAIIVGAIIYLMMIIYLITISGVLPTVAYMSYVKGKELN
ncbi:MAG: hypothetical protein KAS30_03355 [Candidatus Diapherotrites archaeon]|nr:hypothetical protein [Candidatus Diapherotrites archaeon]